MVCKPKDSSFEITDILAKAIVPKYSSTVLLSRRLLPTPVNFFVFVFARYVRFTSMRQQFNGTNYQQILGSTTTQNIEHYIHRCLI